MPTIANVIQDILQTVDDVLLQQTVDVSAQAQEEMVSSTAINSIAFEPTTRVMTVNFVDGTEYQYFNVDQAIYDHMVGAGSVGKYFNRVVRKGFYPYVRMG
jgi:hypothetical protein